jgi:hypothetical protein
MKSREIRLLRYLNNHIGEIKTAREIFEELETSYPGGSGFKSPMAVAKVLPRFKVKVIEGTPNAYEL